MDKVMDTRKTTDEDRPPYDVVEAFGLKRGGIYCANCPREVLQWTKGRNQGEAAPLPG